MVMFTREHYQAVAEILHAARSEYTDSKGNILERQAFTAINDVAYGFEVAFQRDNPAFRKELFWEVVQHG